MDGAHGEGGLWSKARCYVFFLKIFEINGNSTLFDNKIFSAKVHFSVAGPVMLGIFWYLRRRWLKGVRGRKPR